MDKNHFRASIKPSQLAGKLSYELLAEKLQLELGLKKPPSRFTFTKYDEIKHAFDLKKEQLRQKKSEAIQDAKCLFESTDKLSDLISNLGNDDVAIAELIKQVEKLEKENERLNSQNDMLLERFARWQYNLQKMDGVDLNKLVPTLDDGLPAKSK
ncbi:hypothetical protein [Vibrio parahaemolyticus]|uniref:hypothetical protein n=1 Tax=Vibrio parahaemolyticus TaxID=670 RepID=UPI0010AA9011|nr:hypothetical protein [Vibrio parahaemolyticus]THE61201.1 hypothetical protein E4P16_07595 [Vibrio parahaemolyticus]